MEDLKPTKPTGPWWAPEAWKGHRFPQVGDFFVLTMDTHPVGCAKVTKNSCGVWIDGICKNDHFTGQTVIPSRAEGLFVNVIGGYYCQLVLMDPPSEDCDSKPCLCWNESLWEKNHPEYADMPELEYVSDEDEMPELEICNDAVKYHNDRLYVPEKPADANSPPEKLEAPAEKVDTEDSKSI